AACAAAFRSQRRTGTQGQGCRSCQHRHPSAEPHAVLRLPSAVSGTPTLPPRDAIVTVTMELREPALHGMPSCMPDQTESLFPTLIYRASLPNSGRLNHELEQAASALAESDMAGRRWCLKHGYAGYTSYGSLADLPERSEPF